MVRRLSTAAFTALGAIALVPAYAADSKPFAAPSAPVSAPATGAANLLQVTLSLGLVLAAIFVAAWLMRRLRGFNRVAPGTIEILADVALGTKERAVLLQVGQQQVLVGVAPGRVNTLHVLETPIERQNAVIASNDANTSAGAVDFKQILKRSLGLR